MTTSYQLASYKIKCPRFSSSSFSPWRMLSCPLGTRQKLDTVTWKLEPLFTLLRKFTCGFLTRLCRVCFILCRAQLLLAEGLALAHLLRHFQADPVPFCSYAMLGDAAEDKSICQVTKHESVLNFRLNAQKRVWFGSVFYETASGKPNSFQIILKCFLCLYRSRVCNP